MLPFLSENLGTDVNFNDYNGQYSSLTNRGKTILSTLVLVSYFEYSFLGLN